MLRAKDSFDQEIWWQPNYGHIDIIFDNWTLLGVLYFHLSISHSNEVMEKDVDQLILNGSWNENMLRDIFPNDVMDHVLSNIEIGSTIGDMDTLFWMLTNSRKFSVKSAWETLRIPGSTHEQFDRIWEKGLLFKVSFFVWRMFKKRISIGEFWIKIRMDDEALCCHCDQMVEESFYHLFLSCPAANTMWRIFLLGRQGSMALSIF